MFDTGCELSVPPNFIELGIPVGKWGAQCLAHVKSNLNQDQFRVPAALGMVQMSHYDETRMLDSSPTITIPTSCGDIIHKL